MSYMSGFETVVLTCVVRLIQSIIVFGMDVKLVFSL
jgi:hypothetical protein